MLLVAYSPLVCHRAGKELQGVLVSCQADPHIGADTVNDPTLMAVCHVGAGHPGTIPQGRRWILVSVCHCRQVHKVAGSNPCSQDQQAVCSQVYQVN
jgi:hypothetical protein